MQPRKITSYLEKNNLLLVCLWSLFCSLAIAYHLESIPPYHTDEKFYVQAVGIMLDSGDYLTPKRWELHGDPSISPVEVGNRFNKPILIYWLMVLSCKLFGTSLMAMRLCSVLFGTFSILLTYLLARRLFSREAAWLSALILPGFLMHFQMSRLARPDMVLSFFILSSLYFFIRGFQEEKTRSRNFLLTYFFIALGFLAKGPPALIIPGVAIPLFLLSTGNRQMLGQLRLLPGVMIILIVNLPWFLTMFVLHGEQFTNHLLGVEVLGRFQPDGEAVPYYLSVVILYYFPWSFFFISALALFMVPTAHSRSDSAKGGSLSLPEKIKLRLQTLFDKNNYPLTFCLICFFTNLVFSFIFGSGQWKNARYMIPASPMLALILGYFFARLLKSKQGSRNRLFKIPFFAAVSCYLLGAIIFVATILIIDPVVQVPFNVVWIPIFLILGSVGLLVLYHFRKTAMVLIVLGVLQVIFLAGISGDARPFLNGYPMKRFSQAILNAGIGGERIHLYQLDNETVKVALRTMRWAQNIPNPGILRRLMESGEKSFFVMRERHWKEEFKETNLTLVAQDVRWKVIRINSELIRSIKEDGYRRTFKNHLEELVMLTNR